MKRPGRQVTVWMPDELLQRIDAEADKLKCGRSAFLRDSCIFVLAELCKHYKVPSRGSRRADSLPDEGPRPAGG